VTQIGGLSGHVTQIGGLSGHVTQIGGQACAYQHQKKKDAELFLARTHPMARHNQELMYKGPEFWLLH
jgi:hypothetical protein